MYECSFFHRFGGSDAECLLTSHTHFGRRRVNSRRVRTRKRITTRSKCSRKTLATQRRETETRVFDNRAVRRSREQCKCGTTRKSRWRDRGNYFSRTPSAPSVRRTYPPPTDPTHPLRISNTSPDPARVRYALISRLIVRREIIFRSNDSRSHDARNAHKRFVSAIGPDGRWSVVRRTVQ